MMISNKINEIDEITKKFKDNIEKTNGIEYTKGILSDFAGFINRNKTMLYGMLGATALNFLATSINPVLAEPVEISRNYEVKDKKFEDKIIEYYKNIEMTNQVTNKSKLEGNYLKLDDSTLEKIMNLKEGETLKVLNPYWKNASFEVRTGNETNNFTTHSQGPVHKITHEN